MDRVRVVAWVVASFCMGAFFVVPRGWVLMGVAVVFLLCFAVVSRERGRGVDDD